MRALLLPLLATAAFAFHARDAHAESTMCRDGTLVETGDRIEAVLARCGNPSWRRASTLHNRRNPWVTTQLDEWIYDLGDGSFLRYLRFWNGTLEIIEERSREPSLVLVVRSTTSPQAMQGRLGLTIHRIFARPVPRVPHPGALRAPVPLPQGERDFAGAA